MSGAREFARRHAPLGAGAAPLLAVLLARVMAPALGPSSSFADETDAEGAPLIELEPLPAKSLAAAAFAREALAAPSGVSPFERGPSTDRAAPTTAAVEAEPAAPSDDPAPPLSVSAVLADSRTGAAIAVINGKVRRVGDELAPGWSVETIDAATGVVTAVGPRGQRTASPARKR